jgi:excisionase family DNA binding protein
VEKIAYRIFEVCKVSSVGRTTIYAAIKSGDLKIRKIGRRTIITADDLKTWLNSRPTALAASTSAGRFRNPRQSVVPSPPRVKEH